MFLSARGKGCRSWPVSETDELFLASDAAAIVHHTKKVIYLKDGNLIELKKGGEYTIRHP